jgi:hypothetical protein
MSYCGIIYQASVELFGKKKILKHARWTSAFSKTVILSEVSPNIIISVNTLQSPHAGSFNQ